jgi:hypothetical protein
MVLFSRYSGLFRMAVANLPFGPAVVDHAAAVESQARGIRLPAEDVLVRSPDNAIGVLVASILPASGFLPDRMDEIRSFHPSSFKFRTSASKRFERPEKRASLNTVTSTRQRVSGTKCDRSYRSGRC